MQLGIGPAGLPFRRCFNPHPARRPGAMVKTLESSPSSIKSFNPHPARRPGAMRVRRDRSITMNCFNPHPARRPGAIQKTGPNCPLHRFNPHPARRPGAILTCTRSHAPPGVFQSSPSPEAGCNNHDTSSIFEPYLCFNPHPARRPGAIPRMTWPESRQSCFNPHPARRPGAMKGRLPSEAVAILFQSSPSPEAGCNLDP